MPPLTPPPCITAIPHPKAIHHPWKRPIFVYAPKAMRGAEGGSPFQSAFPPRESGGTGGEHSERGSPPPLPAWPEGDKILEIGSGRGDFLEYLAINRPDASVVGIEVKARRFFCIAERLEKNAFRNAFALCGDGWELARVLLPKRAFCEVHIQFPDPWPKRRHSHKRLLNAASLDDLLALLQVSGKFCFSTDDPHYAEAVARLFEDRSDCKSALSPTIQKESDPRFPSFFAKKWQGEGRTLTYQEYHLKIA